jgi:hypothetical protein
MRRASHVWSTPQGTACHVLLMRWLAVSYVVLLLVIVGLADMGELASVVRFVHDVPHLDKVGHLVFALGLGAMLEGATRSRGRALRIAVPLVIAEEISQLFVPGRTFDLLDFAADGVGLAVGTLGMLALRNGIAANRRITTSHDAASARIPRAGAGCDVVTP